MLKDIFPELPSANPRFYTDVNGICFFRAYDGQPPVGHFFELWKSDGTTAGTVLVKDINTISSPAPSSDPQDLVAVGNLCYFTANDGVHGRELWKSDGTEGGTVLVADITAGSAGSTISSLVASNGKCFFALTDATNGKELWVSDGTAGGTHIVKDINPGVADGLEYTPLLYDFKGQLLFSASDGVSGIELWKSDGTAGGTTQVLDIVPGGGSGYPRNFQTLGNNAIFSTAQGLYKYDGTIASFLSNGGNTFFFTIGSILAVDNFAYIGNGSAVWKSDGTVGGTVKIVDMPSGGNQGAFQRFGNKVMFAYKTAATGLEPWISDATAAGTHLLLDINPGSNDSDPGGLNHNASSSIDGYLYFSANDGVYGQEMWRSDLTTGGTMRVSDIYPGSTNGAYANDLNGIVRSGNVLYFTGYNNNYGLEPWVVRGNGVPVTKPGKTDLVGLDSATGALSVAVSTGTAFNTLTWGNLGTGVSWVDVLSGDFDGDGDSDVVGRNSATGQWVLARSNAYNTLTISTIGAWSAGAGVTWTDVQVGDFNGDGRSDVVGRWKETGQWWVAQSTAASFANKYFGQWSANVNWVDVTTGDFNGDGIGDLAGRWQDSGQWWVAQSTGAAFANQYFGAWSVTQWDDVRFGDFNLDGRTDVVGRLDVNGQWYAGISNGTGFANALWGVWSTGITWTDVQVGDFNGDGKADLVGRWKESGNWYVSRSTGSSFATGYFGQWTSSVDWVDARVGDFDGDGKSDIAGRIQSNGQWYVARSSGTAFTNSYFGAWSTSITWADIAAAEFAIS